MHTETVATYCCSDCGESFNSRNGLFNYNNEDHCWNCYIFRRNSDAYEDDDDEPEDTNKEILDYGAKAESILAFFGTPKDKMFFGVELEVECKYQTNTELAAGRVKDLLPNFVITKYDGSLNYGFEIVSAPASLEVHYEKWENFFRVGAKTLGLKSFNTETCGMHIHISREALTPTQLAKMYVFVHEPNNIKFIESIAGRSLRKGNGLHYASLSNDYESKNPKAMKLTDRVGILQERKYIQDGYRTKLMFTGKKSLYFKELNIRGAINDINKNTIEFRIFKGTLNKNGFFKNLEFVRALTQYCKPGIVPLNKIGDLDRFKEFVKINKKEYKYLHSFIEMWEARRQEKDGLKSA